MNDTEVRHTGGSLEPVCSPGRRNQNYGAYMPSWQRRSYWRQHERNSPQFGSRRPPPIRTTGQYDGPASRALRALCGGTASLQHILSVLAGVLLRQEWQIQVCRLVLIFLILVGA